MRCFTITRLVTSSRLCHLFILLCRRHDLKAWPWPCLCLRALLFPWLWKRFWVSSLGVVFTGKWHDTNFKTTTLKKRSFKMKPLQARKIVQQHPLDLNKIQWKLHLSPQVKVLIGNREYSKKGEILFCETWSQSLPISVQHPFVQEKPCNPVQARFFKITAYHPTLFLLPLPLGFLSVIRDSLQQHQFTWRESHGPWDIT